MGKDLAIPDWLQSKLQEGTVSSDADQLISTISSVPRISLKGKQFRFVENGETIHKEHDKIHVVILGVQPEHGMAKTYYEGQYEPGDSSPPDCSSFDGVRPDSWVNSPQSDTCAICPNNKWGSAKAMSGKKAKACRDSKRLMVVNAKNIDKGTIYIFNVTVSSLKALSEFGKSLAKQGIPLEAVITTIIMDEDSDFPKVDFQAAGVLNEAQGTLAITRASTKEWETEDYQAITDQSSSVPGLPAPVAQPEAEVLPVETKQEPAAVTKSNEDLDELLGSW